MLNKKKIEVLQNLYENLDSSVSFSSVKNLYKAAKKVNYKINLNDVKTYLKSVEAYTLHKLTPRRFPTQKVIAAKPNVIIALDLIDIGNIAKYNDNIRFLMYFIDVFSRKVTVIPILDKSKKSILKGLKDFFSRDLNHLYKRIYSDKEPGLLSKEVKYYLTKIHVSIYTNSSLERKNPISERGLKSFKSKLYKYLTHNNTNKYIDVLDQLTNSINNSQHRALKNSYLTPNILHKIKQKSFLKEQFRKMYSIKTSSKLFNRQLFKIGHLVRIPSLDRTQNIFFKGYDTSNTAEVFKIDSIDKRRQPYIYKLVDLANERIIGSFYYEELTPVKLKSLYSIKILKTRVNKKNKSVEYFVTYLNWPQHFNEWIPARNIVNNNNNNNVIEKKIRK